MAMGDKYLKSVSSGIKKFQTLENLQLKSNRITSLSS